MTSFAVQIVERKLKGEAKEAIKRQNGLHVSLSKKSRTDGAAD